MGNAIQKTAKALTTKANNSTFAPEYLSGESSGSDKKIHGARFVPTSDPNWNDNERMSYVEAQMHPDIKPVAPSRGGHSVQLGG